MPFAYPERGGFKLAILARVEAGETLKAICAEPGMPGYHTVYHWRRDPNDAWFGPAMMAAIARGTWVRRYRFNQEAADEIALRRAAGEPLSDILRRPGMPTQRGLAHWRATQMAFGGRMREIGCAHLKARDQALGDRRRIPYDPAAAERVCDAVIRGKPLQRLSVLDPSLPSRPVIARWRRENPDFDARLKGASAFGVKVARAKLARPFADPDLAEAVLEAVTFGASLNQVGKMPGMPCAHTLYRWKKDGEFARQLRVAWKIAAEIVLEDGEPFAGVRGKSRPKHAALRRARRLRARAFGDGA